MSNTLKQRFPRCTYLNGDGGRCARRVKPPETICHIHRKVGNVGALTAPIGFTPMEKIQRIAMRDGHPNQIQALKMLLDAYTCPACAKRAAANEENDSVVKYASTDQKLALRSLLDQIAAIKRTIRIHIASGGLPPQESPNVLDEHQDAHQSEPSTAEGEPRDESEGESAEHERQPAEEEELTPEEAAWNAQFPDIPEEDDDDN